jgi:Bacterial aa3 type cytochrome c oxidase subunit IV
LRENRPPVPLPCLKVCGNPTREFEFRLGTSMADHSEVAYTTADGNDYIAHEQTYEGFIKLVKYGTASVALIVILMAIFLT